MINIFLYFIQLQCFLNITVKPRQNRTRGGSKFPVNAFRSFIVRQTKKVDSLQYCSHDLVSHVIRSWPLAYLIPNVNQYLS